MGMGGGRTDYPILSVDEEVGDEVVGIVILVVWGDDLSVGQQ